MIQINGITITKLNLSQDKEGKLVIHGEYELRMTNGNVLTTDTINPSYGEKGVALIPSGPLVQQIAKCTKQIKNEVEMVLGLTEEEGEK